jgi:hypothetical protein
VIPVNLTAEPLKRPQKFASDRRRSLDYLRDCSAVELGQRRSIAATTRRSDADRPEAYTESSSIFVAGPRECRRQLKTDHRAASQLISFPLPLTEICSLETRDEEVV